jgi:hypothetical protein
MRGRISLKVIAMMTTIIQSEGVIIPNHTIATRVSSRQLTVLSTTGRNRAAAFNRSWDGSVC